MFGRSDVGSDVGRRTLDVGQWTSGGGRQTRDSAHKTLDITLDVRTLDVARWTLDV